MRFLYPLGLLGLIGVPILILVYLIKNRYTEQTIPSTFLWRLSEKFLKRRNPLSKITGIISLILQLLLVITLSLAIAHPIIIIPGAANEYCFILDGSGSMGMVSDGESETRFEKAKNEMLSIINSAEDGSVFSLVLVRDTTELIFELDDDREEISERIAALSHYDGSVEYTDAIGIAQGLFNKNPSLVTYLLTDKDADVKENIEIVNVGEDEVNVSVYDISYQAVGKEVTLTGSLLADGGSRVVDLEVYVDKAEEPIATLKQQVIDGVETVFGFTLEVEDFYSLTVKMPTADALSKDNTAVLYNIKMENTYNALLVSDTPFFLESSIGAVSNATLKVMSVSDYLKEEEKLMASDKRVSGYGLYIFDAVSPKALPTDGAVWFIGPSENIVGSGFTVRGEAEIEEGAVLTPTESSSSIVEKLMADITGDSIYIKKYTKCGISQSFTTLYSYMGNPVIFTGLNGFGNREVVFAYDLHDTDAVLTLDQLILFSNLLDYSFPPVIETTEYYCGDMAEVNVITGCKSIRVDAPSGDVFYADTSKGISEFSLTEVGEYKLTVDISGNERVFYLYSSVPKEESLTESTIASISLKGEASSEGRDGKYDNLTVLFVLAALLFTAEWVVYCYDKYQIR